MVSPSLLASCCLVVPLLIFIVVVFIRAIAPMSGDVSRAFVFAMRTELNASVEK
jgi:hypothetical protein